MLGKGFSLVAFFFKEKFSQDKDRVKRFIQKRESTLQGAGRWVSWVLCCGCVGFSRLWGGFLWVCVTSLARQPPQMLLPPHPILSS